MEMIFLNHSLNSTTLNSKINHDILYFEFSQRSSTTSVRVERGIDTKSKEILPIPNHP